MSQPTAPSYTVEQIAALLDVDPAAGILAAADLREQRANAATPGRWYVADQPENMFDVEAVNEAEPDGVSVAAADISNGACVFADAEHIAAEANPAHAFAAVRRWRGVVERHSAHERHGPGSELECGTCIRSFAYEEGADYPCPDLTETADEARAYLGVTA